jgi:AraC-like DNA-binding protein
MISFAARNGSIGASADKSLITVALVPDAVGRRRIEKAFSGNGAVHFCSLHEELADLVRSHHPELIIVSPRDGNGHRVAPEVASIHAIRPIASVVAYVRLDPEDVSDLPALGRAGVVRIVFRDVDDLGPALRDVMAGLERVEHVPEIGLQLMEQMPMAARSIITYCLRHCAERLSVTSIAKAFGLTRRTLVNRLSRARAPRPATLVAWCRLLAAAGKLQSQPMSVRQAAEESGFIDATAFRRQLRSHADMTPSELRDDAAQGSLLDRLLRGEHAAELTAVG